MNRYGMKHRPFGIGCQPKDCYAVRSYDKKEKGYYSIITYKRKLTAEEIAQFELTELEKESDERMLHGNDNGIGSTF